MKANRLSTRKRDSTMNHKDVQTAEEQENNKGMTTEAAAEEASVIGGRNQKESISSPFNLYLGTVKI
jgi:hypothetical protein